MPHYWRLASRLPPLCTRKGAAAEVVEGDREAVVPAREEAEWAAAVPEVVESEAGEALGVVVAALAAEESALEVVAVPADRVSAAQVLAGPESEAREPPERWGAAPAERPVVERP